MLAWAGGIVSPRLRLGLDYPAGALNFMRAHRLRGNILSQCRWGEYLMWEVGNESRVFIDARWELVYPHSVMEQFLRFDRGEPGGGAILNSYATDFVLLPPNSKSLGFVTRDGHWKAIFADPVAVLFAPQAFQSRAATDQLTPDAAQAGFLH